MSDMPTIKLQRPIGSISIVEGRSAVMEPFAIEPVSERNIEAEMQACLETQKLQYGKAMEAIEAAAKKLQFVYERMIVEHRQAIAKLSIEIARKILSQKIKEGDYQIESIVQEVLNNAPARQNIVVRLNPQDLAKCQQLQKDDNNMLASVKLVADPGIGPAECVVETPKGKVESLIDGHLEQVARALSKAM
jgi:flagellar biosynthesis/type III secretory pathway protein FliH